VLFSGPHRGVSGDRDDIGGLEAPADEPSAFSRNGVVVRETNYRASLNIKQGPRPEDFSVSKLCTTCA